MRERLIELLKKADEYASGVCTDYEEAQEVCADYLLAEGVTVLPCKVGKKVYKVVADNRFKHPIECKVIGFWTSEEVNLNNAHLARYVNGVFQDVIQVRFEDFGKTVFLTREEAEQALSERNKR